MPGQTVVFWGRDTIDAADLWVTDGTAAGTHELTGISGASANNNLAPGGLTYFNGGIIFGAQNATGVYGLWTTDGTVAGTHEIADIANANAGGIGPSNFAVFNGKVLFQGTDVVNHNGLWVTDGTSAGTLELGYTLGTFGLQATDLTVFGNVVLFRGTDDFGADGLWSTDGTTNGTHELTGIAGFAGLRGPDFTVFGGSAFFSGFDTTGNFGLWKTDGTVAGTVELTGISGANTSGAGQNPGLNPQDLTVFNGSLVFAGVDTSGNKNLWTSDGTAAGTHELTGIAGASSFGLQPTDLVVFGTKILFSGLNATGKTGLWLTDGTVAGTHELSGIAGTLSSGLAPTGIAIYGDLALFQGRNSAGKFGLWETDGTAAGTFEIAGIAGVNTIGGLRPAEIIALPPTGQTFVATVPGNAFTGTSSFDTVDYSSFNGSIVAHMTGANGTVTETISNVQGTSVLTSIDKLIGTANNDIIYADATLTVNGGAGFDYLIETGTNSTIHLGTAGASNIELLILGGGTNVADVAGAQFEYIYGGVSGSTNTMTTGAGGGYLIANGGANHMFGGGATSVFIGNSIDVSDMHGGSGANVYYVTAGDTVAGAGTYNTLVELAQGVTLHLGSSHVQQVILNGGTNVVDMTGSTDFVYLYGGTGTNTMTTGAGGGYLLSTGGINHMFGGAALANGAIVSDVFVGGIGASDMHGGSGYNTYYVGANDTVAGGGVYNTLIELASGVNLTLGSAGLTGVQQFILNTGSNTVDASSATSQIFIYGQSGADRIGGGTGNDYLYGAGGANTFVFKDHWGVDTIMDWAAGSGNKIDMTALASVGVHGMSDLTFSIIAGNDAITHGADSIVLAGFNGTLTATNFIFA